MNYKRIYDSFIQDRLTKQPSKPDYFETHHIFPRALGGSDDKGNLIRLTPEDHFFAHLLLAKIYGGKMWLALFVMSGRDKRLKNKKIAFRWKDFIFRKRLAFGWARKNGEFGNEGLKGSDNGNHNSEKYHWFNVDTGKEEISTLFDMHIKYGGTRASWTAAQTGYRTSYKGWTIKGREFKRGLKGKILNFINRDGRSFTGTQSDFCKTFSISVASGSRVCRHNDVTKCGWRLEGSTDRHYGTTRKNGDYVRLNSGKTFHLKGLDGGMLIGKRSEIADYLNINSANVSAGISAVVRGICKTFRGYTLVKIE